MLKTVSPVIAPRLPAGDPANKSFSTTRRYLRNFLGFAAKVGAVAIGGGLACFAHALVPALFPITGSNLIRRGNRMIDERQRHA